MKEKIKNWIENELKTFAIVWACSLIMVWLFTRNFRIAFGILLFVSAIAITHKIAREILLVSALTLVPLGLVFTGMDLIAATTIFFAGSLAVSLLAYLKTIPYYFTASLYVPATFITLVVAETI